MGQKLASLGRRGVAVIAGTALLGTALLVAGQGVASAATPTVTATSATAVNIATTASGVAGAPMTLSILGTPVAGDSIILKLTCSASTKVFASATTSPATVIAVPTSSGNCTGALDQITLTNLPTSLNPTITLTPSYTTANAAAGPIALSLAYNPAPGPLGTFAATVSDATVSTITATGNVPPVTLSASQTSQPISPVTITESGGGTFTTAGSTCTLTSSAGVFASTPTTAATAGSLTLTGGVGTNMLTFTAKDDPTGIANFTISNLTVTTDAAFHGLATGTFACGGPALVTMPLFAVAGNASRIAGPIADATVAAEFTAAFPTSPGPACKCVVLATDLAPFDALSASYLEGKLGTGVLITPENSFGADAAGAIKAEGITTVYVVGGPLAISAATIAAIKATPAFLFGGTVQVTPAANLVVANGGAAIAGATADDTAQQIANLAVSAVGPLGTMASVAAAYTANGVGAYNTTTGLGTAAPGATPTTTAIVVSDAGYQDAVSVGPIAYRYQLPVLLTPGANTPGGTTIGTQAKAVLTSKGVTQVIIAGGQLAVDNGVTTSLQAMGISVLRIAGQDATDTSGQLANFELATGTAGLGWSTATTTFLVGNGDVDGTDPLAWGDLLAAAPLGAMSQEPILQIAGTNSVGTFTTATLVKAGSPLGIQSDTGIKNLIVLGGPLAVSANTVSTMQAELAT